MMMVSQILKIKAYREELESRLERVEDFMVNILTAQGWIHLTSIGSGKYKVSRLARHGQLIEIAWNENKNKYYWKNGFSVGTLGSILYQEVTTHEEYFMLMEKYAHRYAKGVVHTVKIANYELKDYFKMRTTDTEVLASKLIAA